MNDIESLIVGIATGLLLTVSTLVSGWLIWLALSAVFG